MWIENLKDLRQVTHPESKQMYLDALSDLYQEAQLLRAKHGNKIDHISSAQLTHVLGRSLVDHIAIINQSKHRSNHCC